MQKKKTIKRYSILLAVVLFFAFGLYNKVVQTTYQIQDKHVQQPFRVVVLSDLHSCKFSKKELIDPIQEAKPDIILLTGDIIDDDLPMKQGFDILKQLPKVPTYYVSGNHEVWSQKLKGIKEELRKLGIVVLDGKREDITIKGTNLHLLGLDDPSHPDYQKQLDALKQENKQADLTFLLAHRPERYQEYEDLGIDYAFCGHAHGGQWHLPFFLENGLYAPNQGFFPSLTRGVHEFEHYKMIISRGLARESTRIPRFYNTPEWLLVEFLPESKN